MNNQGQDNSTQKEWDLDQIIEMYAEQADSSENREGSSQIADLIEGQEESAQPPSMVARLLASQSAESDKNLDDELFPEELFASTVSAQVQFMDDEVQPVEIHELSTIVEDANQKIEASTTAVTHDDPQLLEDIKNIPDRLAFKIGDVAEIVDVKQYVLRYWETEFDVLKPKKSRQNQRMYSRKDIENVLLIKKLLYRDKFSIEGARKALKDLKSQVRETKNWDQVADRYEHAIEQLKEFVVDIRALKTRWM